MSLIRVLLAAEAAAAHRAVRSTAYRQRHLAQRPFVVAAYNLSGEAAAPLGFCYGTTRNTPNFVIAPEPRNRESRFSAINTFAVDLIDYMSPFLELEERSVGRGKYALRVAADAPQLVVPNRATRDYVGARLGRSLRYLGLGDTYNVPEATQWAGAHLSWFAEHALLPGQSVFLAATELLSQHYATGQSDLEDENLASLLAWIENDSKDGRTKIDAAEEAAYGPVPDPTWEAALEPLVRDWTFCNRADNVAGRARAARSIESLVIPRLREAYDATWRALGNANNIQMARSVPGRWATDVRHWGSHARRCERGIPRFAKRHDALRAAHMLEEWSRALEQLKFQEAIDDPLILAGHDADGRCVSGRVTKVNLDNYEIKPGNVRPTQVPLIEIQVEGKSTLLTDDGVVWTTETGVGGKIRAVDQGKVTIAITEGHKGGTKLPERGAAAVFAALSIFGGNPPDDPRSTPWTHRAPQQPAVEDPEYAGGAVAESDVRDDGSPDLSPEELLDMPLVGRIELDAVPGVVL